MVTTLMFSVGSIFFVDEFHMEIQVKTHAILLYSLLGLAILWGPTASADPVETVADLVLGQPHLTGQPHLFSNTANYGGVSASSLHGPREVAVDAAGNVYVANTSNHRVLVYIDPQNTDMVADLVLGKPNFITSKCNIDFVVYKVVSASTLCYPFGVVVDAAGNVYVADLYNNRVLVYDGFLELTPMPTCAGHDDPFATPLALKKKPNDQFH